MNIFVLGKDPVLAAQNQCNKHIVKMVLETAQLLCSPFEAGTAPYKRTHFNHPCAIWVRQSRDNFLWLCKHGKALSDEYTYRYRKNHKSLAVISWCEERVDNLSFLNNGMTPFPQAMPSQYKRDDPVEAYRAYYIGEKKSFAVWSQRLPPSWWPSFDN
jgi:hypothetical protein